MKIVQINCLYKIGSTGKIVFGIHKELIKNGIESIVCYGNGNKACEKNIYKISNNVYEKFQALYSRITGLMYGGCLLSTNSVINIIKKEKPDVVHLHCLNGHFINIYRIIDWLKKHNIKTILTLHAEFMYTGNCGHSFECEKWKNGCGNCAKFKDETKSWFFDNTHKSWLNMKNAFDGFYDNLLVVSVSPWLMDRAKQSPILADKKHCFVLNGLDDKVFHYYNTEELKKKYNIVNQKMVFHATPNFNDNPNNIKGGYYLLKLAEQIKDKDLIFFVAGPFPQNLKVPENVVLLGNIKDQNLLAKFYSMANVTLLTSKRETFSMITAESLCCGTPVVGFKAGAPEIIAIQEYSKFVEFGNLEQLALSIESMLKQNWDKQAISQQAILKYSEVNMFNSYNELYKTFKSI